MIDNQDGAPIRPAADIAPLSSMPERFPSVMGDRAVHLLRQLGDLLVHCVLYFKGRVDEERLALAIRLTLDAEPVLGCRFIVKGWQPYWARRRDLDDLVLLNLKETDQPDGEMASFLCRPIDLMDDPQVQVLILRAKTDRVLIKLNHLAADGGGIKEYAYLLADIYNRLSQDPGYRPKPNLKGSRSFIQIYRCLGPLDKLRGIRRFFRDGRVRFKPKRFWMLSSPSGLHGPAAAGSRAFVFKTMGREIFRSMKDFEKRHGATINDQILAAYCLALHELAPPPPGTPLRLQSTVDLRRYLDSGQGEAICNLSAFSYLNLGTEPGGSFEEMALAVRDRMNLLKQDMIGLGDWSVIMPLVLRPWPHGWVNGAFKRLFYRKGQPVPRMFPPLFTNIGRISPERVVFDGQAPSDAFIAASVIFPPSLGCALTGFGESLTLSAGFCEAGIKREKVIQLFARMETHLAREIQGR